MSDAWVNRSSGRRQGAWSRNLEKKPITRPPGEPTAKRPVRSWGDFILNPIPTGDVPEAQNLAGAFVNNTGIPLLAKSAVGWGQGIGSAYTYLSSTPTANARRAAAPQAQATPLPTPTLRRPAAPNPQAARPDVPDPRSPAPSFRNLSPNAAIIAQEMRNAGYSPAAIAGVLGNGQAESRFDPNAVGDNGTSRGMFQWRDPTPGKGRATNLSNFARERGMDSSDPRAQAQFLIHELNTTEAKAGQGLRAAQTPQDAAAAFLHFERPAGYNPEQFNPAAVHGWGTRSSSADQMFAALGGQGGSTLASMPYQQVPYQQGAAPQLPQMSSRPQLASPNFSSQNSWLDQAAPTQVDPAALQEQTARNWLTGLAQGNASVDPNQVGGTAKLLAALGAGAMGGWQRGKANELEAAQRYAEATQRYAGQRADVAGQQSGLMTDWQNTNADRSWQDQGGRVETDYKNAATQYELAEANRRAQFTAGQGNQQALHEWIQPRGAEFIHKTDQGGVMMNPDGSMTTVPWNLGNPESQKWDQNAPPVLNQLRTAQELSALGDDQIATGQVLNEVVSSNAGAQVFPGLYEAAVEAAKTQIDPNGILAATDAEAYSQQMNMAVAANLRAATMNDPSWMVRAAQMGNPLARMMTGQ